MKIKIEPSRPSERLIEEIRKSASSIIPDGTELKQWYDGYAKQHCNRLAHDLNYLLSEFPNPKGIRVLELGSVPLILTTAIQRHGYEITGLDIDPKRFETSIKSNKLHIEKGQLGGDMLPFENDYFDVLILNEVFEHLNTNLIDVFDELKRVMKTGGKLFLSTPNLKSMVGIRNFMFRSKSYSCCGEIYDEHLKFRNYGHMGHVREYTPREVTIFLEKMGFEIDTLIYRGKYPKKYRIIDLVAPRLKPFFSVLAIKK